MERLIESLRSAERELDKARTMIGGMPFEQLPKKHFNTVGNMVQGLYDYSSKVLKAVDAIKDVIEAETI